MNKEIVIRRAQIYSFLAGAFLYPYENWTEDRDLVANIVQGMGWLLTKPDIPPLTLPDLQAAHRHTFGIAGSLCYETEYGLPHEYRQSQEMADIAGFYRAFGFTLGNEKRERPDHLAVELEFIHILALKEAYALDNGILEHVEICQAAQAEFLQSHLGRWVGLFAQSVAHNLQAQNLPGSVYQTLSQFANAFVQTDAERLGVSLDQASLDSVPHTPFDPDFSCAGCAIAGLGEQGFVRADTIR